MHLARENHHNSGLDLDGVAQRIVELAQTCVAEHLRTIARSQAEGLMELARQNEPRPSGRVN